MSELEHLGEVPEIEPQAIADHLAGRDKASGELTFLRRVADFDSVDGEKYPAGLDEVRVWPHERLGHYWAELDSHKKTRIVITGAALLLAAGAGMHFAKNRTQRKKMGKKK